MTWSPDTESNRFTMVGTSETDARGIAGLTLEDVERDNSYGFSINVQIEPELESHVEGSDFKCFGKPESFGVMWTSVYAGKTYLLIEMTAATSGMSRILENSKSIQKKWTQFAKSINAIFAYVDLEDQNAIPLIPKLNEIILPDLETLSFDEDIQFSVDLMTNYIIKANKIA